MTVYDLIQELSQYSADIEVEFHCKAVYDTDVEAEFDREDENDTQEVAVTASFDDDVTYDGIHGCKLVIGTPRIVIDLKY